MTAVRSSRAVRRWVVGVAALALAFLLAPAGAARAADSGGVVPTNSAGVPIPPDDQSNKGTGEVSPADKDFVVKVRLAGLWEIAASNMAETKSDDPRIVNIGKQIAAQHVSLDATDRVVAKKLGIDLPNQPNSDQQYWLSEMRNANAATFDQIYIDRLRAAHGKIFPAIATIRASTRNDSVRKLAQEANQYVMTHMTLLESSDIVNYGALPTAPAPAAAGKGPVPVDGQMVAAAQSNSGGLPGVSQNVVFLVLAAALVAGVFTTMRIVRSR
jgi:predicted outer membrane protein